MDAFNTVQVPLAWRRAFSAVLSVGPCALVLALGLGLGTAAAGPLDPDHRFERIGGSVSDVTAILPMPGKMRALLLQRSGELRLVCGGGLVDEPLGTIRVATDCGEKGLLSGVWAPGAVGRQLFVTYVGASTRVFTVGRIDFDDMGRPADVQVIWSATFPAACENLGGGIAFAADGTLLIGTGDHGNPASAGQSTSPAGKILRMTAEGFPPTAPLQPNPPGHPFVYGMGCRNPVRLMADSETGAVWFLDLGPGDNDELNLVQSTTNYQWNASMLMGHLELLGDPYHVWSPAVGPTGLVPYRGDNFKNAGRIMVSAADGHLSEVAPDLSNPVGSSETLLFVPDADGPQAFRDIAVLPDGMLYVVDESGALWRLVNTTASPREPSNGSSIVPLLLSRTSAGELSFSAERSAGMSAYGLYIGDLGRLSAQGYTHGVDVDGDGISGETSDFRGVDLTGDSAWSSFTVGLAELRPDRAPEAPFADGRTGMYFLLSADSPRLETGIGFDSGSFQRPGGNISHTCFDCGGRAEGSRADECRIPFELGTVIEGVGNLVPGGVSFSEDYDCNVIQLSISAEWCGPCRYLASTAEEVYQTHRDQGFTLIDVIFEDTAAQPADLATIERWAAEFGLTHPVAMDEARGVWRAYDRSGGAIPQTWIIGCDGVITDHIVGADPAGIEAAIERELSLGKCD